MSKLGLSVADIGPNMSAFLDTISFSEGTDSYPDEGYKTIVGGSQFEDYAQHPHKSIWFESIKDYSTAAGRYQLLWRYAAIYTKMLKLPDFSPASQDRIAIQQIREQHAYVELHLGNVQTAIERCCNIWASFPGAGYKQHENKMATLLDYYNKARKSYEISN